MDNGIALADAFFYNRIDIAYCKSEAKFHIRLSHFEERVRRKSMVLRQQSLVNCNFIRKPALLYSRSMPF